jgi:electron transport complex protein RnfC
MLEFTAERNLTGGLRLAAHKERSTARPIAAGPIPRRLVLSCRQHRGAAAEPIVAPGERVLKGQTIARAGEAPSAAVHAPTSGLVRAIEERPAPLGNGLQRAVCVVIEPDGEDEAQRGPAWPAGRDERLAAIAAGGLSGLGGAVFPTAAKLGGFPPCKALIVNGAECEPYISCDDMLMREGPQRIIEGILLAADLIGAARCIVAIERDKPLAIEAIGDAARAAGDARISLAELPTVYPAGGERQLILMLTGEEVPSGAYPQDIGYVCQNIATLHALQRLARDGQPLISRVVTVTGLGVREPRNVEALIGTPIGELIEFCGGYTEHAERLILGGNMMGFALPRDDIALTKATNCILVAGRRELRADLPEWACIRCGECSAVCPARLLPQELHRAALADEHPALDSLGLDDCIECGCCDVVCPSYIPLTERFRVAKRGLASYRRRLVLSEQADERFGRRRERMQSGEREGRERREQLIGVLKGEDSDTKTGAIEAAVERARRRRRKRDAGAD